jgi:hypothetical protein
MDVIGEITSQRCETVEAGRLPIGLLIRRYVCARRCRSGGPASRQHRSPPPEQPDRQARSSSRSLKLPGAVDRPSAPADADVQRLGGVADVVTPNADVLDAPRLLTDESCLVQSWSEAFHLW